MKVTFTLENGIVTGEIKRLIEQYNTGIEFNQRKSYDEYYSKTVADVDTSIEILSLLSEGGLIVEIHGDEVFLKEH